VPSDRRIPIRVDRDIVAARQEGRAAALDLGFSLGDATVVSAAISEIARNIVDYTGGGEIHIAVIERNGRRGLQVIGRDQGPGISDVAQALQDGYSTSGSLGLGLPGARRLMDEFELQSEPGSGTTVTMRKWAR
jgi:serine/threonine-protein kinase RsbT